jgi:hypothetical protein
MSNKLFPVCVIDDFYTDPYAVREFALSQKFYPNTDGRWPGARSKPIDKLDDSLYHHFCHKILSIFYDMNDISAYNIESSFQKIKPLHSDKFDKINRGFIHQDSTFFGGVVYLDVDNEERTGTSIYTTKSKWWYPSKLHNYTDNLKVKSYTGDKLTDRDISDWDKSRDSYFESIKVENVFNRCLLFDGNNHHGVPFFGYSERLTQVFFVKNIVFKTEHHPRFPLNKNRVG